MKMKLKINRVPLYIVLLLIIAIVIFYYKSKEKFLEYFDNIKHFFENIFSKFKSEKKNMI